MGGDDCAWGRSLSGLPWLTRQEETSGSQCPYLASEAGLNWGSCDVSSLGLDLAPLVATEEPAVMGITESICDQPTG